MLASWGQSFVAFVVFTILWHGGHRVVRRLRSRGRREGGASLTAADLSPAARDEALRQIDAALAAGRHLKAMRVARSRLSLGFAQARALIEQRRPR